MEFRGIDSSSTPVKILIDISPEYYDRILSEFTENSRMYAILKNGLVIHHFKAGNEFRTVEILCEKFSCTNDPRCCRDGLP